MIIFRCQIYQIDFNFSVINNSPFVENEDLRVSCNIFGENAKLGPHPLFFTEN